MSNKYLERASALVGIGVVGLALWAVHHALAEVQLKEVMAQLAALPTSSLVIAIGLAAISYFVLIGYDLTALAHVKRRLPFGQVAIASFVSYAISNNVGLTMLSGGSVRYRIYSGAGLSAGEIGTVVFLCTLTFGLGATVIAGVVLLIEPASTLAAIPLPLWLLRSSGAAMLVATAGYIAWTLMRNAPISIRGYSVPLPSAGFTASQILLATLDLATAGAILWILLPESVDISYQAFLGIYIIAVVAGLLSHVPGGLGVFESVVLLFIGTDANTGAILGSLIAYRAIYYFLPLIVAALVLAAYEFQRQRRDLAVAARAMTDAFGGWMPRLAAQVLSVMVFLAGTMLLFSAATPVGRVRVHTLSDFMPLPLVEAAHLAAGLAGFGLLIMARGLARRIDTAWTLTAALLGVGFLSLLVKGAEWEEAIVMAVMLLAILPARRVFYRRAALAGQSFTAPWILAISAVILATFWVGLFSYKHVVYTADLWSHFGPDAQSSRALRTGAIISLAVLALLLMRRSTPRTVDPSPAMDSHVVATVAALVARAPHADARLALMGDKSVLFSDSGKSMLMYGMHGRTWVALGDPMGPSEEWPDLIWHFREAADRHNARIAFLGLRHAQLPVYLDLGLALTKLGEEAVVDLTHFTLDGATRRSLRQATHDARQAGLSVEIIAPADQEPLRAAIRALSDDWVARHGGIEPGFTSARLDDGSASGQTIAVLRQGENLLGFASLLETGSPGEVAADPLRLVADTPPSAHDFLLTEAMLWAKARGHHWFNLGLAPPAGREAQAMPPQWSRLATLMQGRGEAGAASSTVRLDKNRFAPEWRPRWLAAEGGLNLILTINALSALVMGTHAIPETRK
jgi:phosphatidylglycerol lysyltransferase